MPIDVAERSEPNSGPGRTTPRRRVLLGVHHRPCPAGHLGVDGEHESPREVRRPTGMGWVRAYGLGRSVALIVDVRSSCVRPPTAPLEMDLPLAEALADELERREC